MHWMIDVTGVHKQMGQIVAGLGLDALVYTRSNPTSSVLHWLQSPDGTRVLSICPGVYSDWGELFKTQTPLDDAGIRKLVADARAKARRTPPGAPCSSWAATATTPWRRPTSPIRRGSLPSGNETHQTLIFTSLDRAGISTQCWRRSGPAK